MSIRSARHGKSSSGYVSPSSATTNGGCFLLDLIDSKVESGFVRCFKLTLGISTQPSIRRRLWAKICSRGSRFLCYQFLPQV